jgi:hypothetical protein
LKTETESGLNTGVDLKRQARDIGMRHSAYSATQLLVSWFNTIAARSSYKRHRVRAVEHHTSDHGRNSFGPISGSRILSDSSAAAKQPCPAWQYRQSRLRQVIGKRVNDYSNALSSIIEFEEQHARRHHRKRPLMSPLLIYISDNTTEHVVHFFYLQGA